jgi:hypothetical protein
MLPEELPKGAASVRTAASERSTAFESETEKVIDGQPLLLGKLAISRLIRL